MKLISDPKIEISSLMVDEATNSFRITHKSPLDVVVDEGKRYFKTTL